MIKKISIILSLFILASNLLLSESRLLRFPDIHDNQVVFVYAGDIYTVDKTGGTARQLTSHKGLELFPKISPDGQMIAFSAEYSGIRQIYVMPSNGGTPKQLTYYNSVNGMPPRGGYDYQVLGWTPDNKNVIFRANRLPWSKRMGNYYTISVDGGLEKELPIPRGGTGDISPDGKKMVYTPIDREWRTWKRYRGGRAQDVWIFDMENITAEQITNHNMTDNMPVWVGDQIYFTSDRDYTLNLFAYDTKTNETKKITNHSEFDVLFPSSGNNNEVIYQNGGYLYLLNTNTNETKKISISVNTDGKYKQPVFKNIKENIANVSLLQEGNGAIFSARGEIFAIPKKYGEIINLTNTPGIREINAEVSPDGNKIVYYSDETGEYEIYTMDIDGKNKKQISKNTNIWMFPPVWSPDSKKVAFGDKNQNLNIINIKTGNKTVVDKGSYEDITYYKWSPDSKWITYNKSDDNFIKQIYVYSIDNNKVHQLGKSYANNINQVFTKDGNYLVFTSERDFNLEFSAYEFDYLYTDATRIYVAPLNNKADEFAPYKNDLKDNEKTKGENENNISINPDNFAERVTALPVADGNYYNLAVIDGKILYMSSGTLYQYDINSQKTDKVIDGINGYILNSKGDKILFMKGNDYGIQDFSTGMDNSNGLIDLSDLEMKIYPELEYKQIFNDAWRLMRDWFYDPNMHGYDWDALKQKYLPLVSHVERRSDLDFIIGELIGEVNAGHCYVNSGDEPDINRIESGLLGCKFEDDGNKHYKISKIFKGENWHKEFRSPLNEFPLKINEGNYLIAINGKEITTKENPYKYLENLGNNVITITVNTKSSKDGAKDYQVKTITAEHNLMAYDWVRRNREYVNKKTDGKIGYIWLPNTLFDGNRELYKWFYPQTQKQALIIDDRYNGGGFIPSMMIKLLERRTLNYWDRRGLEPLPDPLYSHDGPKATLINGYSSSGGDAFPYYFRELGLGKLIGERTWGGLIGISGNPQFIDGGSLNIPTFRFMDTEGNWAVENVGVSPDIEVKDRPDEMAKGNDPTIDKAIEHLMKELENFNIKKIEKPVPPDESK